MKKIGQKMVEVCVKFCGQEIYLLSTGNKNNDNALVAEFRAVWAKSWADWQDIVRIASATSYIIGQKPKDKNAAVH